MNCVTLSSMVAAVGVVLSLLAPLLAAAQPMQSYPSRPVHLIVPFAPGGPADFVARAMAPGLERALGQPFVIENKPGAEGAIATQAVRHAQPDGYTLLFSSASLVPLALLKKQVPFDLRSDFVPISKVAPADWAMYVSADVPARTVGDFVAHARANPGKLNYASSTLNDFMAAVKFMKATGTSMTRIPYKGAGQAMPDLIAGHVQVNFSPVSALGLQYARAGRLRMLAVLSPQRSPLAPDVPTLAEEGVSGVLVQGWLAIVAPVGTPKDVVDRLNGAVASTLADADVRSMLSRQSVQAEPSTPQALAALIEQDFRSWRDFIRDNGLIPE
jgi:tripartite-type tricarboxylate transporter receptor subunit TctC